MLGKKSERVGVGNLMRIWGLKRLSTGLEFTTLLSETNEGTGRNVGEDCFLISPELLSSLSVFSGDLFGLQAEFVSRNHLDYICTGCLKKNGD